VKRLGASSEAGARHEASLISSSSMLDRLPKEKKTGSYPLAAGVCKQSRPREVSTFHAVEFSKTTPPGILDPGQQKASDSRQRPSGSEQQGRIRSAEGSPVVE